MTRDNNDSTHLYIQPMVSGWNGHTGGMLCSLKLKKGDLIPPLSVPSSNCLCSLTLCWLTHSPFSFPAGGAGNWQVHQWLNYGLPSFPKSHGLELITYFLGDFISSEPLWTRWRAAVFLMAGLLGNVLRFGVIKSQAGLEEVQATVTTIMRTSYGAGGLLPAFCLAVWRHFNGAG